jgi:hypothetical protein
MKCNPAVVAQISGLCEMGKEATEAVSRILLRIDILESGGSSKFEYFVEIDELRPNAEAQGKYLLHPEQCMCAAFVRIVEMTSTYGDVWLDEMFIAQDRITALDLASSRQLETPTP